MEYQQYLLDNLDLIDRVIRSVAQRHHLTADDRDEFTSTVRLKLVDRDYVILRRFQGRSSLATYLTIVIERLYLDFCNARWGRWRPSAMARRLGEVAILLEQLVARDGLPFGEAVETLQTNHDVGATREELYALLLLLPVRSPRRFAGEEELLDIAGGPEGDADADVERTDTEKLARRVESVLSASVLRLPTDDQLMLRFRYQHGLSVAGVARLLRRNPKAVYRRLQQVITILRRRLERDGIDHDQIVSLVGHPALTLGRVFGDASAFLSEQKNKAV